MIYRTVRDGRSDEKDGGGEMEWRETEDFLVCEERLDSPEAEAKEFIRYSTGGSSVILASTRPTATVRSLGINQPT